MKNRGEIICLLEDFHPLNFDKQVFMNLINDLGKFEV